MGQLSCCILARFLRSWTPERDLEHAGGFEYVLGSCRWCGAPWMSVFCTASGVSGYERVTPAVVGAIRSLQDARELKEFMRSWGERNV